MMTKSDVRDLLAEIAEHDGREITDLAVQSWLWQADHGNWNPEDAKTAVAAFYAQPQPCWAETDEPRPVLPADIHDAHRRSV